MVARGVKFTWQGVWSTYSSMEGIGSGFLGEGARKQHCHRSDVNITMMSFDSMGRGEDFTLRCAVLT